MHKPLQACTQPPPQGCNWSFISLIQDLVPYCPHSNSFRAVPPLSLMLAWKSLAAAVSWILSCPDHSLVTGAEDGGVGSRGKQWKKQDLNMCGLPVLCDREKPIWPPVRMFKHSCAMSCSLAPAAALPLHPSVTQTAQAPGVYLAPRLLFQFSNR